MSDKPKLYIEDERIPDWAIWIAQDEDGTWAAYSSRPKQDQDKNGGYWSYDPGSKCARICRNSPSPQWNKTLEMLKKPEGNADV